MTDKTMITLIWITMLIFLAIFALTGCCSSRKLTEKELSKVWCEGYEQGYDVGVRTERMLKRAKEVDKKFKGEQ